MSPQDALQIVMRAEKVELKLTALYNERRPVDDLSKDELAEGITELHAYTQRSRDIGGKLIQIDPIPLNIAVPV